MRNKTGSVLLADVGLAVTVPAQTAGPAGGRCLAMAAGRVLRPLLGRLTHGRLVRGKRRFVLRPTSNIQKYSIGVKHRGGMAGPQRRGAEAVAWAAPAGRTVNGMSEVSAGLALAQDHDRVHAAVVEAARAGDVVPEVEGVQRFQGGHLGQQPAELPGGV